MNSCILSLDQGTTSSRAIIFDAGGDQRAVAQHEFPQIYPHAGWVEHDPYEIWETQRRAAAEALSQYNGEITAVGITNQRETTIVWDRRTGEPIFNAIVWQCRRTAELCEELKSRGLGQYVTEHTGLVIDAYFSGTKLKWILDTVPGARERAKRGELLFGTVDSFLIWKLSAGAAHVTDYTNASRTMLFDIDRLCWDETLCRELDIPMQMLPRVVPSSGICAHVAPNIKGLERLAGVPIAGVAGDQQAALFGQACFKEGAAKCTYGTGCFIMMNAGKRSIRSKNGLLTTIAWNVGGETAYALEGSVFNAGSVIKWLRDDMQLIPTAPDINLLAAAAPDNGGVYFVPAFTGLGAPYWDMYARGTLIGLTRGTGRAHIARAVLESIAFQVHDVITAMQEDSGHTISELKADGGASRSDILMQFQSDLLRCAINRPKNVETTALGAAYLAGLATGVWKDAEAIAQNWRSERIFLPEQNNDKRDKLLKTWKRAVERARDWEEHE